MVSYIYLLRTSKFERPMHLPGRRTAEDWGDLATEICKSGFPPFTFSGIHGRTPSVWQCWRRSWLKCSSRCKETILTYVHDDPYLTPVSVRQCVFSTTVLSIFSLVRNYSYLSNLFRVPQCHSHCRNIEVRRCKSNSFIRYRQNRNLYGSNNIS